MQESGLIVLLIQAILIITLLYFMISLLKLSRVMRLEKRINRYTINTLNDNDLSLFDKVYILFNKYKSFLSRRLSRSNFFVKTSKRYEKYVFDNDTKAMDFVASKVMLALTFLVIVIVSNAFWNRLVDIYQVSLSLLIGYYIYDIFLIFKEKNKTKNIENDLLRAITIMNNSFKSGKSIMQAIYIVSNEVDGEIKNEFKKMYIDLTYGLSLDVVFKRFSKRVNIEEVKYMTTSLIILNKTGGNIVNVFASIEKNFFSRRKLKQEMKSIAASAEFMFKILAVMPLIIILMIVVLNPTYFAPLFETSIGLAISLIISFIYLSYIFVVKKIMKVEEL